MTKANFTEGQQQSEEWQLQQLTEGSVEQQARAWLVYLYSGNASEEYKAQFLTWLQASKEHVRAYKKVEQIWRDIPLAQQVTEAQNNRVTSLFQFRKSKTNAAPLLALAASLLIACISYFVPISAPTERLHFATDIGQNQTIELADGSVITLAAKSQLSSLISSSERTIELRSGVAYFDVAANRALPFVVRSGNSEITVLGTEFEVRNSPRSTQVSVTEGTVTFAPIPATNTSVVNQVLKVGEQAEISAEGQWLYQRPYDHTQAASWKRGRLTYINEPLAVILEEVNRYRSIPIHIESPELAKLRLTTSFATDKTQELLTALSQLSSIKVTEQSQQVLLSKG